MSYEETRRCDACEQEYWPGSGVVDLPFGSYCSQACADQAEAEFSERMRRRGFQEVQPEIFGEIFDNPFGD